MTAAAWGAAAWEAVAFPWAAPVAALAVSGS